MDSFSHDTVSLFLEHEVDQQMETEEERSSEVASLAQGK